MSSQPVVLVTGSSEGGLGHALCKAFRAKDYRVFATARKLGSIKSLEADGCDLLALDVTNPESINAAAKELSFKTGGRLDIIVNNAGTANISPSITEDLKDTRVVIETNLIGPILIVQAFVPLIIESNAGKGGLIVNVSSIQALTALPWCASYAASKAGIRSLSSSWRMELKGFGVRVMDVIGGGIKSNMNANVLTPPENAASSLYWNWDAINAQRLKTSSSQNNTPPPDVANVIVTAATKRSPPSDLYAGDMAWMFRYMKHLPLSWVEWLFSDKFGASLVAYRS